MVMACEDAFRRVAPARDDVDAPFDNERHNMLADSDGGHTRAERFALLWLCCRTAPPASTRTIAATEDTVDVSRLTRSLSPGVTRTCCVTLEAIARQTRGVGIRRHVRRAFGGLFARKIYARCC